MQVLICEDDSLFRKRAEEIISRELKKQKIPHTVHVFGTGEAFLKFRSEEEEELIFMDICLPDISGIRVVKQLKDSGRNKNVIFLTNYDNLVFESLDAFPFSFMRKENLEEKIGYTIQGYINWNCKRKQIFEFPLKNEIHHVRAEGIMYLTHWNHQVTLSMANGDEISFRGKIKECEQQLWGPDFFKPNQGSIVNLKYCRSINDNGFLMKNGTVIQVSRAQKREAREQFLRYHREGE